MAKPIDLSREGLMIWPGFKASVQHTQLGLTVAVDRVFKFISTKTCLDHIYELKQKIRDEARWKQAVNTEFAKKSIMANWGAKKTYIVFGVDFERNPGSEMFEKDGQQISVADYFLRVYDMKISEIRQPLLVVKSNGKDLYLPSEFCLFSNVPESIRKGPNMRNALMKTKIVPRERIEEVLKMVQTLQTMRTSKSWGFEINAAPVTLETNVLGKAQIFDEDKLIHCDE